MAPWQNKPGATLLIPSGARGLHLFIVILGPIVLPTYGANPQTGMVSVTTLRSGIPHDEACELNTGDHPFIRHASYIAYRHMRVDSTAHVQRMVADGVWKPHEPCSPELLDRVVAGARASRLIPREFKLWLAP